ncbi:NAD-dependent epimerase/dehydratase family protein [Limnobacter sp.]|uniref:NAD-dependent epimerase/dehydratase family protein n=1 Tax=Limnobacter sp. TaxID=2003368 RepID=UPI002FE419B0
MAVILLTGASGFVGQHLLAHLQGQGHDVRLLLRNPLPLHIPYSGQMYLMQSVTDKATFSQACKGVNVVLHVGGLAHITNARLAQQHEPFQQVNVQWTQYLAETAFRAGVHRFVLVSSIGAVGNITIPGNKLDEHTPCNPSGPYALSKLQAEQALADVARHLNGSYAIVRPPLVHGLGAPGNLAKLAAWVNKGIPLPLAGLRNQRSLVHVENLVQAIELLAFHASAHQQIFHVADSVDYSTTDILNGVGNCLGVQPRLFGLPLNWLRWVGKLLGKQAMADQLTANLQVDSAHLQRTLGYRARLLPIEV